MASIVCDDVEIGDIGKLSGSYPSICFVAVAAAFLPAIGEHEIGRRIRQLLL